MFSITVVDVTAVDVTAVDVTAVDVTAVDVTACSVVAEITEDSQVTRKDAKINLVVTHISTN